MTSMMQFDSKVLDTLATVLRTTIEGEVVNATYWVTKQLKHGLELEMPSFEMPSLQSNLNQISLAETRVEDRLNSLEGLLEKISIVVDKLDQQAHNTTALNERLTGLESSAGAGASVDQASPELSELTSRISTVEETVQRLATVTKQLLSQHEQTMSVIEQRLAALESSDTAS